MNDAQIQRLISALSENTKALETVLARDPLREFVYGEGEKLPDFVALKAESNELVAGVADSSGRFVFSSSLNVIRWRFVTVATLNTLATAASYGSFGFKIEFSNDNIFSKPQNYYGLMKSNLMPASYTLNTGLIQYSLDHCYNIAKRFARLQFVIFGNTAGGSNGKIVTPMNLTDYNSYGSIIGTSEGY
jgi:hypothetical protein